MKMFDRHKGHVNRYKGGNFPSEYEYMVSFTWLSGTFVNYYFRKIQNVWFWVRLNWIETGGKEYKKSRIYARKVYYGENESPQI